MKKLLGKFFEVDSPVEQSAVQRRAEKIPTHELATWIESTVANTGRSAHHGAIERDLDRAAEYLAEARINAESLVVLISELERRS